MRRSASSRSLEPSSQLQLAVDGGDAAPDEAHVVRERALREREEHGERGRKQRCDAQLTGDRRIAADHREATPREAEPQVRVEAAAEELEVVGDDEEEADGDEEGEPRARRRSRPTTPIPHAAAIEIAASPTSTPSGMLVRSGRPRSSSSAWAPIPTASPKAATAAPRRPHATREPDSRRSRRTRGARPCTAGAAA